MTDSIIFTDALGQELVIGATYGYVVRENSHCHSFVGELVRIGNTRCSIKVKQRRDWFAGTPYVHSHANEYIGTTVSVSSILLFPVHQK